MSSSNYKLSFVFPWNPQEVQAIQPGLNIIAEAARMYKTKKLLNDMKSAAVQSIMNPKDFTKFVNFMEAVSANVEHRAGVYPTAPDNKPPNVSEGEVVEEDVVEAAESALGSMAGLSSALAVASISNEPPTTQALAVASGGTVQFHPVFVNGGSAGTSYSHKFEAPFRPIGLFVVLTKNKTVQSVVHVQTNVRYDRTSIGAFQHLVLTDGVHDFKVFLQLTLKGGTPTPTVDTTDFDSVGEALMGGASQCMAFYKGMRYPVILDKEYALLVIQLGEEQLVTGLHLGCSLAEQAADYADQLRIITSAIVRQYITCRDIEAAAASIECTEEEMTRLFYMNVSSLLKLKKIPNDDDNGFLFLDGVVQDRGETPQFNIASNGKMMPGCVSLVTEKSSTLREVLQDKNLTVPEDCKVLGAGVPVGFGLDTPFGDVVTKDCTFNLVVRLRGGGVPAPIGGTFRGATQLGLPDPAEGADRLEFSVVIQDTTDQDNVLAMWEGQHFPLVVRFPSFLKGMRMCLTVSNTNQQGLYEEQLRKMVVALRLYGEDLQGAAASVGCSVTEMAQAFFGYITQLWAIKALPADENHGFFFVDRR